MNPQRERMRRIMRAGRVRGPGTPAKLRRQRRLEAKVAARMALRGKMARKERTRAFHRLWANLMKMGPEAAAPT